MLSNLPRWAFVVGVPPTSSAFPVLSTSSPFDCLLFVPAIMSRHAPLLLLQFSYRSHLPALAKPFASLGLWLTQTPKCFLSSLFVPSLPLLLSAWSETPTSGQHSTLPLLHSQPDPNSHLRLDQAHPLPLSATDVIAPIQSAPCRNLPDWVYPVVYSRGSPRPKTSWYNPSTETNHGLLFFHSW